MTSSAQRSRLLLAGALLALPALAAAQTAPGNVLQFVVTSDSHYGVRRAGFRGSRDVDAQVVNLALVDAINRVPALRFPADAGVRAGRTVQSLDLLIHTGDIANREENGIQPAAASWAQFRAAFLDGVHTQSPDHTPTSVLVVPGNHDATNALGFWRPLSPAHDATAMAEIYNIMRRPPVPLTAKTFDYVRDRIHTSRDVGGVHLLFLEIWPDSAEREWIANDLSAIPKDVPVLLFTHDQPAVDPKHFHNPFGAGDINATDRFENLLTEHFKDGVLPSAQATIPLGGKTSGSLIEERALAAFLKAHPQIRAYFHGNNNAHEFYLYRGPDATIALPTIRVDSPMKGERSGTDESKLSFEVVSVDAARGLMTVRECLWNVKRGTSIAWGASRTYRLR